MAKLSKRAERAKAALDAYAAAGGSTDEPFEDNLTDLLTDLMHLADEEDEDFDEAIGRAEDHFDEEDDS